MTPQVRWQVLGWSILLAGAGLALYVGWRTFWFLCDDAFIAFRYVGSAHAGWGYTWNPPPFEPVEGYTSFLWVVLLDLVWRLLGVTPPVSANWLSLAATYASLALVVVMALRLEGLRQSRWPRTLVAFVLLGVLSNRTFLAWSSSGLEQALFTFLVLAWVLVCCFMPTSSRTWPWALGAVAASMALTRPDGYLFVGVSVLLYALFLRDGGRRGGHRASDYAAAIAFLVVPAHLIWRFSRYGALLPNTYYAKHVAPWPEMGIRYVGAFVLEYGLLLWLGVAAVWAFRCWRRHETTLRPQRLRAWASGALPYRLAAVAAVLAHFAYYTFVIGGDHFEFRVYHHLVPLLWLSLLAMTLSLTRDDRRRLLVLAVALLLSWPIPWLHWWGTRELESRAETLLLLYPVAPHFPVGLRWYARAFDRLQHTTISHFVGTRHQEHKVFWKLQESSFPERPTSSPSRGATALIWVGDNVGVPGWTLPHVAVLDRLGLNDWVIARTPAPPHNRRVMGHDRRPPPGYLACFRPNVGIESRAIVVRERNPPPTWARVVECETRFRQRVQKRAGS